MAARLLAFLLFAAGSSFAIEVSTGFLIGPKHDPRAFYFRSQPGAEWQKSYMAPGYRKQAQGRLLGVQLPFAVPHGWSAEAALFGRVLLQSPEHNLFAPDGTLRPEEAARLLKTLQQADEQGTAVELVLFHPSQDQNFEAPEAFDEAVRNLTHWLIRHDQRHVMLNPGGEWFQSGWDFENYVPQHLSRFAQIIRDCFQERRTDYALPVALSASIRLAASSALVQEADVLILRDEGLTTDPKGIERPLLVVTSSPELCREALQRFSGCLLEPPADGQLDALAPMVRSR